jgi:hypothetical protein
MPFADSDPTARRRCVLPDFLTARLEACRQSQERHDVSEQTFAKSEPTIFTSKPVCQVYLVYSVLCTLSFSPPSKVADLGNLSIAIRKHGKTDMSFQSALRIVRRACTGALRHSHLGVAAAFNCGRISLYIHSF